MTNHAERSRIQQNKFSHRIICEIWNDSRLKLALIPAKPFRRSQKNLLATRQTIV